MKTNKITKTWKTIYTVVLITKSGELSTVSFLDREDALAYCVEEAYDEQGFDSIDDPDWGDEVYSTLNDQGFYESDLGGKFYIEEAKLCEKSEEIAYLFDK